MFRRDGDEEKIIQALGYKFKDKKLLLQALTRRSALNEGRQDAKVGHFQRLEFISDKVTDEDDIITLGKSAGIQTKLLKD